MKLPGGISTMGRLSDDYGKLSPFGVRELVVTTRWRSLNPIDTAFAFPGSLE
jgi:hypothetical protein